VKLSFCFWGLFVSDATVQFLAPRNPIEAYSPFPSIVERKLHCTEADSL